MPARGGAGEEALSAGGLHGRAAVGTAQAVAIAVVPNGLVDDLLPAAEVRGLFGFEGAAFFAVGAAGFPPGQPGGAKGMDKEVEQAGDCLLYTSPSPRDRTRSRMPSSA